MLSSARARVFAWVFRSRGRESGPVLLVHRRVFILPTRHGLLFALFLGLMLLGSLNYNLSLGYVLTFLLATLGLVSILHTFRNLAHLRVSAGRTTAVFAGETGSFPVLLESPENSVRWAIGVSRAGEDPVYVNVPAGVPAEAVLRVEAPRRGWLRPGRLRVFTQFPLGLLHAWSYVEPDVKLLVYAKPDRSRLPLPMMQPAAGAGAAFGSGDEDFSGMRPYRPGDSPRQVAWKAAAREQGLFTKLFSGRAEAELWLDWDLLAGLEAEARLSRLTRWVLEAEAAEIAYGLRIPGKSRAPAHGPAHRDRCLQDLALFGLAEEPA
ncbi:MAG TPA: DUF58 domain-containing protein [Burkholderiales bacterium]